MATCRCPAGVLGRLHLCMRLILCLSRADIKEEAFGGGFVEKGKQHTSHDSAPRCECVIRVWSRRDEDEIMFQMKADVVHL